MNKNPYEKLNNPVSKAVLFFFTLAFIVGGAWLQILTVKEAWNELIAPLTALGPINFAKAFGLEVGFSVVSGSAWSKIGYAREKDKSILNRAIENVLAAAFAYGIVNLVSYLLYS